MGCKVHRQMQLQQGDVTAHEVVFVKFIVNNESIHCHLLAMLSGMLEPMVPEQDLVVRWFMGPVMRSCIITCLLCIVHPCTLT